MHWVAALLLLASASSAGGQVNVDIGIRLPSAPRLVIIPDTPVYYAPDVAANYFRYGKEYWVFKDGQWYVGRQPRGPWSRVERERVPTPVLRVPSATTAPLRRSGMIRPRIILRDGSLSTAGSGTNSTTGLSRSSTREIGAGVRSVKTSVRSSPREGVQG